MTAEQGGSSTHASSDPSHRSVLESFTDELIEAAWRHASPSGSLLAIPGPVGMAGRWSNAHEGFARTFLAAAFRVRGSGGADPFSTLERYATGIAAGVDPHHPERWPTISERRQSVVEASSIAIGLAETRPWLWDQLDEAVKARTVDYLAGVVGTSGYRNNWTWFQTVIETFLAQVGGPWSQADLDRNDEIQEALYVGDGWYSDGINGAGSRQKFDYYAGWVWNLHPLLTARMAGVPLQDKHRERMHAFIEQAVDLIGSGGAPLFQGRSLAYRFAMLAPFWSGVIAGATPLPPGVTRELADRVIGYFRAAGAINDRGILSIGWHGEYLRLRQLYSGGASTYWASMGLLGLLLPTGHPEWSAVPPARPPQQTTQRVLQAPGWIVVGTQSDGVVRVINHGTDGDHGPGGGARADRPLYQRLAYSNVTAPDLSVNGIARPQDSHVALLDTSGCPSHRGRIQRLHLDQRVGVSRSSVHWLDLPGSEHEPDSEEWIGMRTGPVLTIASVVNGVHEVRLAWWNPVLESKHPSSFDDLDSAWPKAAAGPWRLRFDGWPLPIGDDQAHSLTPCAAAQVGESRIESVVLPVRHIEAGGLRHCERPTPYSRRSVTPWAESAEVTAGQVSAVMVVLGAAAATPAPVPGIAVRADQVTITWPNGPVDAVPAPGATQ